MRIHLRKAAVFGLLALMVAALWPSVPARADLTTCGANTNVRTVSPGSTTNITFSIQNTDANDVHWLRIIVPSSDEDLQTINVSGWNDSTGSSSTILSGGDLAPGDTLTLTIGVGAANVNSSPSNWVIYASDDPNGATQTSCTGTLDLAIQGPVYQPLTVSNVQVSSLTAHSAVVSWDTNKPASSQVKYGADSSYGNATPVNSSLVSSHSMTISGLSTNTGYHFQVESNDGSETATSGDNTLVTADEAAISEDGGIPAASGGGTSQVGSGKVTTPTGKPTETTPPTIGWTSSVRGAYAAAPAFSGTASDNDSVAKIEYSTDGGKNWAGVSTVTPIPVTTGTGKRRVTTTDSRKVGFSFTPIITEDGNYIVLARATDASGNQTRTAAQTLVIDRLPPRFGGEMVAFGSQVARPDASGRWQAVAGLDQTITLSAVGGPINVTVEATKAGSKRILHSFVLRRDSDSGLWRGNLGFQIEGTYGLAVSAVDGAGNKTTQALSEVNVMPAARLVNKAGQSVGQGKITLYYRLPNDGTWTVWDGAGYGQSNPQNVDRNGSFQLMAPAGTYYLKAESRGYQTFVSQQFTLDRPTALVPELKLVGQPKITIGPWTLRLPWISFRRTAIQTSVGTSKPVPAAIIGQSLPNFVLPNTAGGTTTSVGLLGKPTVVTVLSTWASSTSEQLPALVKLQANHDLNIVPLVLGEHAGQVQAFLGRAGYDSSISLTIDADITLSGALGVPNPPTHYVLDRKGKVKAIFTGVLTADQLLALLSN